MKILLIDDEHACVESLERAIKPTGHDCVSFNDPQMAMEAFRNDTFDVVVTDFKMHKMNGTQVLKNVKEVDSDVQVIILTAYADVDNAIDAVNNRAYAFFQKPINLNDFMYTLTKVEKEIVKNTVKRVKNNPTCA